MLSKEYYYLAGALKDGSIYYYGRTRNYYIIWYSKSFEYLTDVICGKLQRIGFERCQPYRYKKKNYRVRISSKKLYEVFIIQFDHSVNKCMNKWEVPNALRKADLDRRLEYVKGFADAEGSVIESSKGVQIDISQKCREALEFLKEVLEKLGIRVTGIYLGKDNVWRLRIASYESIIKFNSVVGFSHPDKKGKLLRILARKV